MPSFPDVPLEGTLEVAPGADLTADQGTWPWQVLTCAHPTIPAQTIPRLTNDPVTVKRGVTVGASNTGTTTATLTCFNHDGVLTPFLPTSPLYPYIDVGTPIRHRIRTTTDTLWQDQFTRTTTGGLGTSTSGHTYTYGSGTSADFSTNGSAAKISIPTVNTVHRAASSFTCRDADFTFDCSVPAVAVGAVLSAGPVFRYAGSTEFVWPSVEFRVGGTVGFKIWDVTANVFSNVTSVAAGISYTANQLVRCRIQLVDGRVRAKVWLAAGSEPSTWLVDVAYTAHADTGQIGWYTWVQAGNTNTMPMVFTIDNATLVQPPYARVQGYIADVRPTYNPLAGGTTWSTVQIDVGGIGSRLEKQQSPSYSPMRRSVQQAVETPIAYWPLEDEEGSTYGASAFPGGPSMVVTGPAVFAFSTTVPTETYLTRYGTKPMVSLAAGAQLTGPVPRSTVTTEWAISFIGEFLIPNTGGGITSARILQWETPGGTHSRWALIQPATGGYIVRAYEPDGTTVDVVTYTSASFLHPTYTVEAHQVAGNIFVELFVDDISIASGSVASTQAPIGRVVFNPDKVNTTASTDPYGIKFVVGHLRVVDEISVPDTPHYTPAELGFAVSANSAWYREPAHRRVERLCQEERVPITVLGGVDAVGMTQLNAQQDGPFSDLLTAAVEAESGGLLYEDGYGYQYLPRFARYNLPVAMTIDMATYCRGGNTGQEDILVPELDSRAANYWTITRTGGMSGSYAAPAAYRLRRGTIAEERTLDVLTDDMVGDHAAWRTHLAVDGQGANYPSIPLDLAANPALIDVWLGCQIGDRVQRVNQPAIAGLGVIDQVVEGITETISPTQWTVDMSASPARVWDVFVVEDTALGWADSDSSTFRAATSSAVSLLVDVLVGPRWVTGSGLSIPVTAATGEDMLVTAISGTSNPQTFTVTRGVNGFSKAIPADTAFSITDMPALAL